MNDAEPDDGASAADLVGAPRRRVIRRAIHRLIRSSWWVVAGLALVSCQEEAAAPLASVGQVQGPIVNGQTETGYAAVGALTAWFGEQYGGSFCTGTLIGAQWVLTAAHCLDAGLAVSQIRFYIGNDARDPNSGQFYRAAELIIHESYVSATLTNDIALVRLQSAVPGVTAIPFNVADLEPYEGQQALFVGFGAVEGVQESGSGLKRSASIALTSVYAEHVRSPYSGTGTCFGDSGGPALLAINNTTSVVALTSAGESCQGASCDPCRTATWSTRVDVHGEWIAGKLGLPPPLCQDNAAICACAGACLLRCGTYPQV